MTQEGQEVKELEPFFRPANLWWYRLTNRMLPPTPANQVAYQFGDLRRHFKHWHYLLTVPLLLLVFGLNYAQIKLWWPTAMSPLWVAIIAGVVLWSTLRWKALFVYALAFLTWLLAAWCWRRWRRARIRAGKYTLWPSASHYAYTDSFLNDMAVIEEQWFREGSENWSWWQRLRSCFGFGAVHLRNLFYPVAAVLSLSVCGALFMYTYLHVYKRTNDRQEAVLAAALVHRVYNRIALTAMFSVWGYLLAKGLLHLTLP